MSGIEYRPILDTDTEEVGKMLATSFTCKVEEVSDWHERVGLENIRVALIDRQPAAALVLIRMGMWFGGRSVPAVGIQGVGTAPEFRSRGVCREMMRATIREAHADGVPLSALYAATFPLYRSVGYEFAGGWFKAEAPLNLFPRSKNYEGLHLRRMKEEDHPIVAECYTKRAQACAGMLDRNNVLWQRIYRQRNKEVEGWVLVNDDQQVEGYLVYSAERHGNDLGVAYTLHDIGACTPRGWGGLGGFLRSLYSMGGEVSWHCGPSDPLLNMLPERGFSLVWEEDWMLRIVNLESALSSRGWSPTLNGEVHLDISDDLIESNNGRFVLAVSSGQATVKAGGDGCLCMGINGLAPLYSGRHSAEELEMSGLLSGANHAAADADALAEATSLFAGPAPGMPDMF